jgi:hypothetical protein
MTRRTTGLGAGVAVALLLGAALAALATLERWTGLDAPLAAGARAGITLRAPRVVVGRGEVVSEAAALQDQMQRAGRPPLGRAAAGLFCGFLVAGVVLAGSFRGRPERALVVTGIGVIVLVAAAKVLLLFSSVSSFGFPVAARAILAAAFVDRTAGWAVTAMLGLSIAALTPFDGAVALVLVAQGAAAAILVPETRRGPGAYVLAGIGGGLAAALAYAALVLVRSPSGPFDELGDPLHSPLLAAIAGGLISGLVASVFHGAGARLFGAAAVEAAAPSAAASPSVAVVPKRALPPEVVTTTPGFAGGSSDPSREPPRPRAEEIVLLGDNEKLTPGTLVIGPPPATHPHGAQGSASTSSSSLPYLPDPDPDPSTSSSVPPKRRPPPPPRRG